MKKHFLISLFFIITLCNSCTQESKQGKKVISVDQFNEAETVVFNFYKWYLKDIYLTEKADSPALKITPDSTYEIDNTEFLKFLNDAGCFSINYYNNRISIYKACNEALVKQGKDLNFPQDAGEKGECDFLGYQIWTGGQGETLNTVDILSSTITKDTAKVIVAIGDSIGNYIYSYPVVTLLKENNKWKISDVLISFNAPKTK